MNKNRVVLNFQAAVSFSFFLATAWNVTAFATKPTPEGQVVEPLQSAMNVRFPVEKEVLKNGLTVLYMVDHSAPLISYHTWFRVGSKDEKPGYSGIAHLFEHMMFRGTPKFSGDQFDRMLQENGATNNAFTTQDYTGYYIDAPSSKLELLMDIESDRMAHLKIDQAALAAEREVVKEEKRMRYDDNPAGLLWHAIFSTVYKVHPYQVPVIGSMEDLDRVSEAVAQDFHRVYYSPTNAVVVLAGDFDLGKAKQLVQKYYGQIARQEVAKTVRPIEPVQKAARAEFIKKDVQAWTMSISYPVPAAGTPESYAFDLLATVLGKGASSRLYKRLVYKDRIATGVSVMNTGLQDSGMFQVIVNLAPGSKQKLGAALFSLAQRAVYGEMWRPRNIKLTQYELEGARNQTLSSIVDGLKTIHGKAAALAQAETLYGDYNRVFTELATYLQVTPEQIRIVAEKYLGPEKSNLVVLRTKAD